MPRVLVIASLVALLLVPATGAGTSRAHVRGTVSAKSQAAHLVGLKGARLAFSLRVPGSLAAIRIGERVELRGSTLSEEGHGSDVLARGVSVVGSQPVATPSANPTQSAPSGSEDDELEITGKLTSLSPVTVVAGTRTASCSVPAGMSLNGFAAGDVVEMKCRLVAGAWMVQELKREGSEDDSATNATNDDSAAPAAGDDDHHGGPGSGDDSGEQDG